MADAYGFGDGLRRLPAINLPYSRFRRFPCSATPTSISGISWAPSTLDPWTSPLDGPLGADAIRVLPRAQTFKGSAGRQNVGIGVAPTYDLHTDRQVADKSGRN